MKTIIIFITIYLQILLIKTESPIILKLNSVCSLNSKTSNCGAYAQCLDGKCACEFGSKENGNQIDCVLFRCDKDQDCFQFSRHSICDDMKCQCSEGNF